MSDQRILRGSIITAIFLGVPRDPNVVKHLVVLATTYDYDGTHVVARLEPNTGKVYRYLANRENITWIRGQHALDSEEVAALQVAYALTVGGY